MTDYQIEPMPLTVDPKRRTLLRSAFGQFLTGVTVVTTRGADGVPRGFTANSFSSVSMDPPLLLVCPAKSADCYSSFAQADRFAVNILSDKQREASQRFASKSAEKFAGIGWEEGPLGQPLLTGAAAWFECAVAQLIDAGDHAILLGEVLEFSENLVTPLAFHKGRYVEVPVPDIDIGARA